jgi:hypothetical protein
LLFVEQPRWDLRAIIHEIEYSEAKMGRRKKLQKNLSARPFNGEERLNTA